MRRNRIAYICAAAALSAAVFFGCENTAGGRGSSGGGSSSTAAESGGKAGTGSSGGSVFEEMPSEPTAETKFIGTWVKADEKETGAPKTITFRADGTYTDSYEGDQDTGETWSATEEYLYIMKQVEPYPEGVESEFLWDGHILDISALEGDTEQSKISFELVRDGVYKNKEDPHTMLTITGSEFILKWKTRVFKGTVSGDRLIENASGNMWCYSYKFSDGGNTLEFDNTSTYTKQR